MNNEQLESEKLDSSLENPEEKIENSVDINLEELVDNSNKEDSAIEKINERLEGSSPDFQEKTAESGTLQSLSEKIRKSNLFRAGIVASNLFNANPALASDLSEMLNNSDAKVSGSVEASQDKNNLADRLGEFNISNSHGLELEKVYKESSDEVKEIILDELENGKGLNNQDVNNGEDSDILIIQQHVIDLQSSGEMGPRREGGVVMPFDEEHSGETDGVEYTGNVAENGGKQKLTIENASESQIRAWVDYLKKNSK